MKQVLIVCMCLWMGIVSVAEAAPDPYYWFSNTQGSDTEAERILSRVGKKYKNLKSIKTKFSLSIYNPSAGINEKQQGTVYIKGEKYRVETSDIERISDNKSVWTYFKDEEEVQINEFDPDEGELSPAQLFIISQKDFIAKMKSKDALNGIPHYEIDLVPKDKGVSYKSIRVFVNQRTNLISKITFFEKDNSRFTYTFDKFETNQFISDDFFKFQVKKGIEVIDLR